MPTIGVVRWQPANRLPIVYRLRCPALSSVTKHLPRSPTAAHTALALDSAPGGGQARGYLLRYAQAVRDRLLICNSLVRMHQRKPIKKDILLDVLFYWLPLLDSNQRPAD